MSDDHRTRAIDEALKSTARGHEARIIYAAETGSRAYGWATPESDTDVGCIFVRRRREYLRLTPSDEASHTRHEGGIDMTAWDLRKALKLLQASNVRLLEWLHAETVFREAPGLMEAIRELATENWSPNRVCEAHWKMAQNRWNELRSEYVNTTTYLPVVRSLLAVLWIEEHAELPPTALTDMMHLMNDGTAAHEIQTLVERRKANSVKHGEPRNEPLNVWIERQMSRCHVQSANNRWATRNTIESKYLDEILIATIEEEDD